MRLIKFIKRDTNEPYYNVLLIAAISGMANGLLIIIVNHAAEAVANQEDLTQYFLLYMITFALFLYGQWYAFERAILIIENAIFRARTRLTAKVQQVDLAFMESMGTNTLYGRLTQNDTLISQSVPMIVANFQMFSLMTFSLIYLGYISPISLFMTLAAMGLGLLYFIAQSHFIKNALQSVRQKEKTYFKSISQLVNGFKEVKVNQSKGQDLLNRIAEVSSEAQDIKSSMRKKESRLWGFGRLFIYMLLPIVVFIVPGFSHENTENIFKIKAMLLFLIGPTTMLTTIIPLMNRVSIAINDLFLLEQEMDTAIPKQPNSGTDKAAFKNFQHIKIDQLSFHYPSGMNNVFSTGPVNGAINRGELLLITGDNGSGKSTLLKLLTGLYYPTEGNLYADTQLIDADSYPAYRNLFSIVFTDFHLFDRFYGLSSTKAERVNYWLEKMRLQHKVQYKNGGFTHTNLSNGQLKRLAFIVAMLEDKPILVLDEFTSDQDPQFQAYFYETLLVEVKAMGKTIIAATHDEHYFHVADRVWKMDEGRIETYA